MYIAKYFYLCQNVIMNRLRCQHDLQIKREILTFVDFLQKAAN